MRSAYKLMIAIAIPLAVGIVSSYFTQASVNGWFTTIKKPSFNPPNWVFAPVWTTLYILMGISFYIVWKNNTYSVIKRRAIIVYFVQLTLNFSWSIIFFGAHQPGWAFINILTLLVAIVFTIYWFERISIAAAWLLAPYVCWVSFATILNYAIWKLN